MYAIECTEVCFDDVFCVLYDSVANVVAVSKYLNRNASKLLFSLQMMKRM